VEEAAAKTNEPVEDNPPIGDDELMSTACCDQYR
jgi:hypothetical protein